jgi:predicted nucleotidyltransferase
MYLMNQQTKTLIVETVLRHYPTVQGIYLFGSYGAGNAWPDSDVDVALLLPPVQAKMEPSLAMSECRFELAEALKKEVDLINLRFRQCFRRRSFTGNCSIAPTGMRWMNSRC